jgi:hypothetical protein
MKLLPPPGAYDDLPPRCLMDRRDALREISLHSGMPAELRAVVYAYGSKCFLASATTGIQEAGPVRLLAADVTDEQLGLAVLDLLLQCQAHEPGDSSTWPVYVESGAKSMRAFEEASVFVQIRTVNTAIRFEASRRKPPSETYIGRMHAITVEPARVGGSLRAIVSTVRLLDSQDALF